MADKLDLATLLRKMEMGLPAVGVGGHGMPFMPPLPGGPQAELRNVRSGNEFGLSDYVAEQTGSPLAGMLLDKTAKLGRATGDVASGSTMIPWLIESGANLGEAASRWVGSAEAGEAKSQSPGRSDDEVLKELLGQRKSLDEQRATAVRDRDSELRGGDGKKAGRGKNYDAKEAEVGRLTKEMERLDTTIAGIQKRLDPEYTAQVDKLNAAEATRRQSLAGAPKPFDKEYPTWQKLQTVMPALVAAGTAAVPALAEVLGARFGVRGWRKAIKDGFKPGATHDEQKVASDIAQKYATKQFPEEGSGQLSKYLTIGGIGALEGAGVANYPQYHNSNLPAVNPERAAYEEFIKQLPAGEVGDAERKKAEEIILGLPKTTPERDAAIEYFGSPWTVGVRTATGALEGGAAAVGMSKLLKSGRPSEENMPRPQTHALDEMVKRNEASATAAAPPPGAPPLPPGIKLDKNGVAYDVHTGQKINKRYFQARP
jgi:hypothetical protein